MIKTTTINAGKYYWVKTCKECEWRIAEAYILVFHMRIRFTDAAVFLSNLKLWNGLT